MEDVTNTVSIVTVRLLECIMRYIGYADPAFFDMTIGKYEVYESSALQLDLVKLLEVNLAFCSHSLEMVIFVRR